MPTTVEKLGLLAGAQRAAAGHLRREGHLDAAATHDLASAVYAVGGAILRELEAVGAELVSRR